MGSPRIDHQTRAQRGEHEQSALFDLTSCTAFFGEAKIQQTTIDLKPNVQILFASIKLRFLRFSSCNPLVNELNTSNPTARLVLYAIGTVKILIDASQEAPAELNETSQMQVPAAYAPPEPQARGRLHNALTSMGNIHKSTIGVIDSMTDRTKPVIKDTRQIQNILPTMKSLEDNADAELRSKLRHQCAEELKQIKEEDLSLLDNIAEDDDILREEMQKIRSGNGHVFWDNTAENNANTMYGDFVNKDTPVLQKGGSHYFKGNKATGSAQAHYGNAYGGVAFGQNRPAGPS